MPVTIYENLKQALGLLHVSLPQREFRFPIFSLYIFSSPPRDMNQHAGAKKSQTFTFKPGDENTEYLVTWSTHEGTSCCCLSIPSHYQIRLISKSKKSPAVTSIFTVCWIKALIQYLARDLAKYWRWVHCFMDSKWLLSIGRGICTLLSTEDEMVDTDYAFNISAD